ncbi:serine/threonine protein kinase [Nakamurella antarctica]|uniref:non-specific serine/threonine protein kinase n=2 Tax=Nakamurella antarctica TaxID=1902245 RepID=A0A3G8ZQZ4_9ACTN|nr:serine/threonine protein kinase [Nakamurella antarctica]
MVADRYRLDRVLGKGSMGTVWAAYDETLRRRVAIKEIYFPAGLTEAEAHLLIERTLREARAIAQLSHPNVITLYDILTLPTGPVIVMELLAARSLGEVLKEVGPLSEGQAATVGLAVSAGLLAAHDAGITHRDVKPGNVLIGGDGRIKLTDFGIARSAAENAMTAVGLLLGSPAYIAPEVATGAQAGPAADAWGLGALLFATVEGKPPFDKSNPVATLMSVVNDPIPSPERAGNLRPIIEGLLVKDPQARMGLAQARTLLTAITSDAVDGRLTFPPIAGSASARPSQGAPAGSSLPRGPLPPSAAMPPPPWAADAAESLAALPPRADTGESAKSGISRPTTLTPTQRWMLIIGVLVVAAALGFWGVRLLVDAVAGRAG